MSEFKASFTIDRVARFNDLMNRYDETIADVVTKSLRESLEAVLTESKEQYVPIDTGFLKNSGGVRVEEDGRVIIEYTADYALAVHEINKHYKGGKQWKYLETPMKAHLGDINAKLKEDVAAALSGAATFDSRYND